MNASIVLFSENVFIDCSKLILKENGRQEKFESILKCRNNLRANICSLSQVKKIKELATKILQDEVYAYFLTFFKWEESSSFFKDLAAKRVTYEKIEDRVTCTLFGEIIFNVIRAQQIQSKKGGIETTDSENSIMGYHEYVTADDIKYGLGPFSGLKIEELPKLEQSQYKNHLHDDWIFVMDMDLE